MTKWTASRRAKFERTMAIKRSKKIEDPAPQFLVKDNIIYRKVTMTEVVEIFQEWLKHHDSDNH